MTDISENDIQVVRKWLDGGCPSWGVPADQISKLCLAHTALEAQLADAREALAESDRQAEKLEALLDPYIAWEGKPAKAYVASGVSAIGWTPITEKNGVMTCSLPADETVVEVMLKDGTVCRALYSCNIMETGDWDFVPVAANGEPEDDADSIASEVVAWRPTHQPARPTEQAVTEAARAVCDNAKLVDIGKNGAFNYVVSPYLIDALKAAMEAGR